MANNNKKTTKTKKGQKKPAFKFTRQGVMELAQRIKAENAEKGTVQ